MSGQIGSHQQGAFSTPTNGQPTDASVVLSNDNANRTTANAHDADATIHIQSSVLASRPAAGTAGRVWITSDGLRAYVDSGSVWGELDYLSKTAGGTVAGAVTMSAGLTVSSGGAAITGTSSVTGSVAGVFSAVGSAVDPTVTVVRSDNAIGNKATLRLGTSNGGFASNNAYVRASQGSGVDSWVLELGASNTGTGGVAQTLLTLDVANGLIASKGVTISAGGLAVTGGITGTLSTAAQPNITSVGILASTHLTSPVVDAGGVTVTAGDVLVSSGVVKASAQGLFGLFNGSGSVGFLAVSSDTAGTATGGAASLPAAPVGFFLWKLGATTVKVPYYNN